MINSMKSIKRLASSIALVALVFIGCQREETFTGIDTAKPTVTDFSCAEAAYKGTTAIMSWNAADAIAAGATSFTLQFVEDKDGSNPNNYDATISTTVKVTADSTGAKATSYTGKISGQTKGNCYYVRVRANYRNSIYSEWVWLTYENGEPALFKLGRGIITEGIEDPYLYKVTPTSTGLIIKWDPVEGANGYVLEYKKSDSSDWTTISLEPETLLYKISGLPSETSYDVRALTITAEGNSDYCTVQTVSTRKPGSFKKEMSTADELIAWLEGGIVEVNPGESFSITADIDLEGAGFVAMDEPLLGEFNGNGHTIKGLTQPLFYQNEGTIKDLKIEGKISIEEEAPEFGSLVKINKGTISNVESNVAVSFDAKADADIYIGGVCCHNEGTLKNVTNSGKIDVEMSVNSRKVVCVGGVAATSSLSLVNCVNNADVSFVSSASVLGSTVAGIAGYIEGNATDCTNNGTVTLQALYSVADTENKGFLPMLEGKLYTSATYATPAAGGIAGYSYSEDLSKALLDRCTNNGTVNFVMTQIDKYTTTVQRVQAAGVIANPYGLIKDCTNNGNLNFAANTSTGSASGGTYLMCCGGIGGGDWFSAGQDKTTYDGCINNGSIEFSKYDKAGSGNSACGGICGWPGAEGGRSNKTTNCINTGNINFNGTGKARVGGIHGGTGHIVNCKNEGNINSYSSNTGSCFGGIAAFHSQGHEISGSVNKGNVKTSVECTQGVGGLIGNAGNAANSKIYSCEVNCSVVNAGSAETTGILVGYFNGTSKEIKVGTSSKPIKVKGSVTAGGVTTKLTAGNYTAFLAGSKNYTPSVHTFATEFDTTIEEGETPEVPTAPEITLTPGSGSITVEWNAIENALYYLVEYKKTSADEWTVATKTEELSYTIKGLDLSASYDVRVKAVFTDGDYSSTGTTTTEGEPQKLDTPVVTATPYFTSAKASWEAVENATEYDVYLDGAKVATVSELSYTAGGLKHETTHKFGVIAKNATLQSAAAGETEFKTGYVRQHKANVGARIACLDWQDVSQGTNGPGRAYTVELYKDAAGTQLVYAFPVVDCQHTSVKSTPFGASSWYGKANNSNLQPPTRLTFTELEAGTTYYARVKTHAEAYTGAAGSCTMAPKAGECDWSELVPITTEATHTAVSGEILYEGFDDMSMQADLVNSASGMVPRHGKTGGVATITFPWGKTNEWACYALGYNHGVATWGYSAKGAWADGSETKDGLTNYVFGEKAGSLKGWMHGDQTTAHPGYVKLSSSKLQSYISTPAISGIEANTPVTINFNASVLMYTANATSVDVEVFRAASSTVELIKNVPLKMYTVNENPTATDYEMANKWDKYSVETTLNPGDVVTFINGNDVVFYWAIDEISIVKK